MNRPEDSVVVGGGSGGGGWSWGAAVGVGRGWSEQRHKGLLQATADIGLLFFLRTSRRDESEASHSDDAVTHKPPLPPATRHNNGGRRPPDDCHYIKLSQALEAKRKKEKINLFLFLLKKKTNKILAWFHCNNGNKGITLGLAPPLTLTSRLLGRRVTAREREQSAVFFKC